MGRTIGRLLEKTATKTEYLYGEGQPFSFSVMHIKSNAPLAPLDFQQRDNQITVCFICSGCADLLLNDAPCSVRANQVLVLFENVRFSSGGVPVSKHELYAFSFDPKAFLTSNYAFDEEESRAILCALRDVSSPVFDTDKKKMHTCFQNLYLTADSSSEIGNTLMRNRFLTTITEVIKYSKLPFRKQSPEIERVLTYIEENITEPLPVPLLAKLCLLSESRFKVKFAEYIGVSPHEYILRRKIEAAKQLLADPLCSVTEACLRLSFSSSQYFSTVFKRITTMSPSEYRRLYAIDRYGHPWD